MNISNCPEPSSTGEGKIPFLDSALLSTACSVLGCSVENIILSFVCYLPVSNDMATLDSATTNDILFIPLAAEGCHRISDEQELGKAVAEIGDWETLCKNLGVEKAVINALRNMVDTESTIKKSRCLEAYLNTGRACWEQVVKVVADHPFYNARLARNITCSHATHRLLYHCQRWTVM